MTHKHRRLCIMIVEDNHHSVDTMALLLWVHDHNIKCLHSRYVALQVAAEFDSEIILFDIRMPIMHKYEAARRFKEVMYGQEEDCRKTKAYGGNYHMVKPVD